MLTVRFALVLALIVGLGGFAAAQVAGTAPAPVPGAASAATNLQIVSPRNNEKIAADYVNVRYQITNPAASENTLPAFQLQLDDGDLIQTSSTEHTFAGLTAGAHAIAVELVDANNTPVIGTRTEVRFMVAPNRPGAAPTGVASRENQGGALLVPAAMQSPDRSAQAPANSSQQAPSASGAEGLPSTGSALPLLSIIGFGVLVGGIASALKTR